MKCPVHVIIFVFRRNNDDDRQPCVWGSFGGLQGMQSELFPTVNGFCKDGMTVLSATAAAPFLGDLSRPARLPSLASSCIVAACVGSSTLGWRPLTRSAFRFRMPTRSIRTKTCDFR